MSCSWVCGYDQQALGIDCPTEGDQIEESSSHKGDKEDLNVQS